jgi:isopropylmalate/homocitrate/citramalate synthase
MGALTVRSSAISALSRSALAGLELPERVQINDCTLREGEQTADVNFTPEEKLRMARALDAAGVGQIQIGYPGRSRSDFEVYQQFRSEQPRAQLSAVVLGYVDSWREQIDAAADAGADVIDLVYVTSDLRMEHAYKTTRPEVLRRVAETVAYGKQRGLTVAYAPADTTRSDLAFLEEVIATAVDAGNDRFTIADTLGAANPPAIRQLVTFFRDHTDLPLSIHCHDDFGLAMANTVAAVEAGATLIDVAMNGLGDRAGNTVLDEIVTTLEIQYGIDTGVDLNQLHGLAKLIVETSGVALASNKGITGDNAFAHKLETHVQAVLAYPPAFEALNPADVGHDRFIAVGRYSGPISLRGRYAAMGVEIPDQAIPELLDAVEALALEVKRSLTDEELRQLLAKTEGVRA